MPKPTPVTESEVTEVVLRALSTAFRGRPITEGVIRRGLANAAWRVIELHLREVGKGG
jgi:hypothetical protein